MPGMPSRWISCCCFGVISRLSQTKPFFDDEALARFLAVEIGHHRGEQFLRLVDVDQLARLGEQRRRLHVGGEDLAVAVENVRPRGGDRVLADAAAGAVAVAVLGEHDEAQRDDAVDGGESDDGEAEPRLGFHVAVDVAAIEKRAHKALPAGLRRFCARAHRLHRDAAGRGRLGRRQHGGDRIVVRRRLGRARGQPVEVVELRGQDRAQRQMAFGQALDAAGRVELGPFGAQRRDGVALAAQLAGELGDALGLQGGIEFDLVDDGRRQDERGDDEDIDQAHGSAPLQNVGQRRQARRQIGRLVIARGRLGALGGA